MLIYIIMPVAAIMAGVILCRTRPEGLNRPGSKKTIGETIYCMLAFGGLFTVSAIRYAVGYDYILYANWFNSLRLMSDGELMRWTREKGFSLPAKILADAGFGYQVMFAVIAFVIAAGVMALIYRYSSVSWVSVTMFLASGLYFNSMNFMRQFIAAIIIAFALPYITRGHFFRFLGLVLFASVFHVSALLLVPFYFVFKIRFNSITLSVMIIFGTAAYIFVTPVFGFIQRFIYTEYDLITHREAASGLSPVYTIVFAVFFALAFLLRKLIRRRNKHYNTLIFSMYFAVLFSLLGTSHGIISRLSLLFVVAPVLILSADIYVSLRDLILLTFKDVRKIRRFIAAFISLIFLCAGGLYYNHLLNINYNGVVPYQTVFDKSAET